jgi:hypothetical protein
MGAGSIKGGVHPEQPGWAGVTSTHLREVSGQELCTGLQCHLSRYGHMRWVSSASLTSGGCSG